MQKLWDVALNDLRVTFVDRTVWISLVLLPLVLIFTTGLANGGFGSTAPAMINLDVIDYDRSDLSVQFIEEVRAMNPSLRLCPLDNDEGDACNLGDHQLSEEMSTERVRDSVTTATLVIPSGFGTGALTGEPVSIIYRSQQNITQTNLALESVQAARQRVGSASVAARVGVDVYENSSPDFQFADDADEVAFKNAVYDRATTILNELPETVNYRLSAQDEAGNTNVSGFSQSVPGIGSMYVMSNVMVAALILLQERKQWTLQRLMTMPVSSQQVIGGKMLARFIIGMMQYAIAFGFGFLLGLRYGSSPLAILLVMVAFTLCSTALALLFATFVTSDQQAGVMLNLVVLVLAPLGGAWWPLEIVPQWMQTVGHISPIAWAMDGFRAVIFNNGGLEQVVIPVLVLLAITVVLFLLAVRRFKYA